jgi:hypothetical protein
VWEKPKAFESSNEYAISFLLAVFAKQPQCEQPPHVISEWFQDNQKILVKIMQDSTSC